MKIGRIKISKELVESEMEHYGGSFPLLFTNFFPIHIKFKQNKGVWIYTGTSNDFDEIIIEGESYPFYTWKIENGEVKFKRT